MGSAKEPPEFRIEDVYATSTTLIMRGLKRNITREMFVTILCFG
jgi:hypothetical protein